MNKFENKTVLITGGSRGIGKAIALKFANQGANIIFNYLRNHQAALETFNQITSLGVKCKKIKAHLGDEEKIKSLFTQIKNEFDSIDILINNAASGVQKQSTELEPKHWDWTMNINATAPWLCAIKASEIMPKGSSIINITSEGSRKVLPYYFSVGTSKAALEALTRYLAVELSSKGINVNAVSGGFIETDAFKSFPNKKNMVKAGQNTFGSRQMTAEDLANVVTFLCSKEAEMIKGQIIIVDGGVTLTHQL